MKITRSEDAEIKYALLNTMMPYNIVEWRYALELRHRYLNGETVIHDKVKFHLISIVIALRDMGIKAQFKHKWSSGGESAVWPVESGKPDLMIITGDR